MANDDSTRAGFDLSLWRGRDPLTIGDAACLWYGLKPGMTEALIKLYPVAWSNALERAADMVEAAKAHRLPIHGAVATRREMTRGRVMAYVGSRATSRPAEYREVEDWGATKIALADLRAYAESIGQRPGFFFPGAPVGATGGAVVANHSAPAPDTKEPPQEWRNGLKRMAWEEAVKLVREHGVLRGPALWAAMKARDDVKEAGRDSGQIEPRVCRNKLNRGEGRVSKTQVQNTWRKTLDELLKNHA